MFDNIPKPESAILIAVGKKNSNRELAFDHLEELESLADTAGAKILEKFYQELDSIHPATAIGKGKVEEIKNIIEEREIQLVIFDDELSPVQFKNLEREFNVKVIDRSGLILDIFAKHAKSQEAKTQVELAQLQYLLPRLSGLWTHLSKQYGGIGTKGPGETQIEVDRRMIKTRIQKLKDKLNDIDINRKEQSKSRVNLPRFAIVGYTNAGKSTLMNSLTDANVYIEDKLFATLDTTVRSFLLPDGQKALLSDTVGFIRKLPMHLVASFRSTLAEAIDADFLIHLVDVTHKSFREHILTVEDTLVSLKISQKPIITVFNKVDQVEEINGLHLLENEYPGSIFISAKKGMNLLGLMNLLQDKADAFTSIQNILLPYDSMSLLPKLYDSGDIVKRIENDYGIELFIKIKSEKMKFFNHYFEKYLVNSTLS